MTQRHPDLARKVRFLERPESYPERPARVETKESHMSWVFLTEHHAYKLKKPVRYSYLDFSTLDARQQACEAEVQLNRRFAPDAYLGTVALTLERSGELQLAGPGEVCDWLVKMIRLPAEATLERQIADRRVDESGLRHVIVLLARFYRRAAPVEITPDGYLERFRRDLHENLAALAEPDFALDRALPRAVADAQARFLDHRARLLRERVEAGRIIEAHGDLRPEHIYPGDPPVIMDCLEFNRDLRLLDPVDELAYLALECRRLGAPALGALVFSTYREITGDRPPEPLIDFYAGFRAMLRAKLAIWHLRDEPVDAPDKWRQRCVHYLELAAEHARAFG